MKQLFIYFLLLNVMISCTNQKEERVPYKWTDAKPPIAEITSHQRIIHGDTVIDNYYWMIDYFKKGPDSTKVVNYLKAENAYLDTMMKGTDKF
ncbi:MAG: oligopeptidase B, partial [Pedobacter sp.]|nr:oligopeptidase B [Pedobacter sp.]